MDNLSTPPAAVPNLKLLRIIEKHIAKGDTGSMLINHPNTRMQVLWDNGLLGIQVYQQGYFHVWITEEGHKALSEALEEGSEAI